ncbi:hypothetical protein G6O67_005518 [Ophiocordyceps sinensis]|uniref:BTB domain-containing protein n=1 Tax=Ophiocordyceps sinensis TaxID=72228 RepID=A0A8H4V6A1_9HYPO|nr:hypothetical protein G6O67_005518 [Ophiocordyceps sinensis]
MEVENLIQDLAGMMRSGDASDLKFVCKGKEFNVHKFMVYARSTFLRVIVLRGFWDEQPNVINMDQFDLNAVEQFVKFLYTSDYEDREDRYEVSMTNSASDQDVGSAKELATIPLSLTQEETLLPRATSWPTSAAAASLAHHLCVHHIAHYYGVETLVSLAEAKIRALVASENEDKTWVPYLPSATKAALTFPKDDDLIDILASATAENLSTLVVMQTFKSLKPINDFALRVLKSCNGKIQGLVQELKQAKSELADLNTRMDMQNSIHQGVMLDRDEFRRCLVILNKRSFCRNITCDSVFGCYVETDERILRCTKCKCKHVD